MTSVKQKRQVLQTMATICSAHTDLMDKSADIVNVTWPCLCAYGGFTLTQYCSQLCFIAFLINVDNTYYQNVVRCIYNYKFCGTLICERKDTYMQPCLNVLSDSLLVAKLLLLLLARVHPVLICVHSTGWWMLQLLGHQRKQQDFSIPTFLYNWPDTVQL